MNVTLAAGDTFTSLKDDIVGAAIKTMKGVYSAVLSTFKACNSNT